MLVQIKQAIWPARATRRTHHQAQHAVPPAARPVIVGLGQQIMHGIDTLRVKPANHGLIRPGRGIQIGVFVLTGGSRRRPATEVRAEVGVQRRATTGVVRIEQKVLGVDRDKLGRAVQLVAIRRAQHLIIDRFTLTTRPHPLWPARQIQQARIITQTETSLTLPAAPGRQPYRSLRLQASAAVPAQPGLRAETVVQMYHLVQQRAQGQCLVTLLQQTPIKLQATTRRSTPADACRQPRRPGQRHSHIQLRL